MSKFWMVTEDPDYDDDGVMIDEDFDQESIEDELAAIGVTTFDPFETVNS